MAPAFERDIKVSRFVPPGCRTWKDKHADGKNNWDAFRIAVQVLDCDDGVQGISDAKGFGGMQQWCNTTSDGTSGVTWTHLDGIWREMLSMARKQISFGTLLTLQTLYSSSATSPLIPVPHHPTSI